MASSPLQLFSSKINQNPKNGLNKINAGTPKRRLSYNGTSSSNSTPISMSNIISPLANFIENSPNTNNENQNELNNSSPFIKRKCISKEQNLFNKFSNSPYLIASSNLYNIGDLPNSPKHLNESFETLQLEKSQDQISKLPSRTGTRFRRGSFNSIFNRHKSAPLTSYNLNQIFCNSSEQKSDSKTNLTDSHQPLNDISNQFNLKLNNQVNLPITKKLLNDDLSFSEEQKDDVTDLENLIFGTNNNNNNNNGNLSIGQNNVHQNYISQQQNMIKHALEVDANCRNLIGDRSKQHILPVIQSAKHQDLYCISPETLVEVLENKYDDQIDEYIIIDSRYPYEFEGGHIRDAKNIFTKEKLYEEMFLKRLHYKNTNLHKLPVTMSSNCLFNKQNLNGNNHSLSSTSIVSMETDETDLYSSPLETNENQKRNINYNNNINNNNKRVIIIFHCEFSSERGPSLLRFLRNQDRSLNEHIYPNLFYPELYLLEGGYKSFYENFKNYCDPQTYKPMLHAEHLNDLKHFRAKAKSWEVSRHNYLIKCTEGYQRKQVLLNQIARSAAINSINSENNNSNNQ